MNAAQPPSPRPRARHTAWEFFAGGGLARLGLEKHFVTTWANDFDPMKAEAYRANFGLQGFQGGDIALVNPATLPGRPDLAWASFPCQDLSLAGNRGGLQSERSGAFFGFVRVIEAARARGRAPAVLVLENVPGLLTSKGGADFAAIVETLDALGYRVGALEIETADFLPQSRARVFVVAVREGVRVPAGLTGQGPEASRYATRAVRTAVAGLPDTLKRRWIWWRLDAPPARNSDLRALLDPQACCWWSPEKTAQLLTQLSPVHRAKLEDARARPGLQVGAVYRRIRIEGGERVMRAEVRFDGLAGCLRTPAGGSSRQFLLFVEGETTYARALNAREAMRLMGVPDSYLLPESELAGLKIAGDGVAVPVVAWLSRHILAPLVQSARGGAITLAA